MKFIDIRIYWCLIDKISRAFENLFNNQLDAAVVMNKMLVYPFSLFFLSFFPFSPFFSIFSVLHFFPKLSISDHTLRYQNCFFACILPSLTISPMNSWTNCINRSLVCSNELDIIELNNNANETQNDEMYLNIIFSKQAELGKYTFLV